MDNLEPDRESENFSTEQISARAKPNLRANPKANRWFFYSPKNDQKLVVETNIAFCHAMLLESNVGVDRYRFLGASTDIPSITILAHREVIVYFTNGSKRWFYFRSSKNKSRLRIEAKQPNSDPWTKGGESIAREVMTELDLKGKEILIDNWIMICAAITRARKYSAAKERAALAEAFEAADSMSLGSLLNVPNTDPALMLAIVGKCLQSGFLNAELDQHLFGLASMIYRHRK